MEIQANGGNRIRRLVFGALGLTGIGLNFHRPLSSFRINSLVPFLLLGLVSFCVASIVWSDSPSMTMRRIAVFLCLVAGAYGAAKTLSMDSILYLAVGVSTLTLALGFGCEVALGTFRPWSADYRFAGTVHPNTQGLYLTSLCLGAYCLMRQGSQKRYLVPIFLAGLAFILLTKSRTSCAGLLLSLFAIWFLRSRKGMLPLVVVSTLWMAATSSLVFSFVSFDFTDQVSKAALLGREEQAESLTGRLPIWETLLPYIQAKLLFGYGYDSFWIPSRVNEVSSELHWGIREAHSAYIDTFLSIGAIGLFFSMFLVVTSLTHAVRCYYATHQEGYAFIFGLIVFGLVNAFTESGMIMPMFVPFVALTGIMHLGFFTNDSGQCIMQAQEDRGQGVYQF